jgi:hypothetical protein
VTLLALQDGTVSLPEAYAIGNAVIALLQDAQGAHAASCGLAQAWGAVKRALLGGRAAAR